MKSLFKSVVFLLVTTISSAAIVKISNTVIQNGTSIYSVFKSPDPEYMLCIQQNHSSPVKMMSTREPRWATHHVVDATPDINVIGKDLVRVYFTAFNSNWRMTQIGVAITHRLWPGDAYYYQSYTPLSAALYLPGTMHCNLSEPSLSQSMNSSEDPVLFYTNHTHIYQVFLAQGLFNNGDVTIQSPSLEWEGGAMRSPRALEHNGEYYVLYTAADGVTVGVLRSQHHGGPYQKKPRPVGVLRDARTNIRTMHKDNIKWDQDGWPHFYTLP